MHFSEKIYPHKLEAVDAVIKCKNLTKFFSKVNSSSWERKIRWNLFLNSIFRWKKNSSFKNTFLALDNISLSVKKGDSVGIIGLNGSGKSTFLQLISGTLRPSSGTVNSIGKIGALLELGSGFNPDFTGKENVFLNARILGLTVEEIRAKYESIISFSGIGKFVDQPVRTYSSGMVVRLAFAVIVNTDPDILIIDEALAVGDARFQSKCFSYLESFKDQGKTLLFVSHDTNSIARLCDSAILLHNGKLINNSSPKEVINQYSKIISGEEGKYHEYEIPEEKFKFSTPSFNNEVCRAELLKSEKEDKSLVEEYNYGGEKAQIIKIRILNGEGNETNVISSSEAFEVNFTVVGKALVSNPIYALTIRDTKGQQIYGHNTLFSKLPTSDLRDGEIVRIRFQLTANLGSGKYLISLGVTRFNEKDELEVIHRRYDAEELQVINLDGSFGIANCNCSIKFQKQSEWMFE